MRELNMQEVEKVSGGWSNDNNNLISTVVRHAGIGAMGGAIGGPKVALAGAVIGAMTAFSSHAGNN